MTNVAVDFTIALLKKGVEVTAVPDIFFIMQISFAVKVDRSLVEVEITQLEIYG